MKINILTLFPEMFTGVTQSSILGRACQKGVLDINLINIRDYSLDKHNKTDDTPFGGGPGMVMMAQPAFDALKTTSGKVIYMSPRGSLLCREKIEQLSSEEELTILCGHYEGMDQRVLDYWNAEEISVGDYILTGGELPAMVLIDAVARFLPGVLGNEASAADESIYSGLLECDQYTKPRNYQGMEVPEILTNGNHKLIHLWQYENALNITRERRPDLWKAYIESEKNLTKDEKKILEKVAAKEL
ncbi:MAG: tRNA (guanosine(37)-N1)-methyltransferase TrmD [Candidatus Fimisoma sp.]|nr:tRNA (guanosine(37)-N1)-methyltransferase TrmD [Bacillota bacterium]MDD7285513.1 tRNA (guanosine(37)-N1)-methyltransferase TrmD [Bacillota bacterium]MDY4747949.1 tRNA (guanosine(37)-N1)-methyltransferase TrmD [Candidatus Fimisoma sp.]